MLTTPIGRLRTIGLLEGLSFLLLLLVAMPLKYALGMPQMVRWVGLAHGLLFVAYLGAVAEVSVTRRWPLRRVVAAVVASLLPAGPLLFDARLRREEQEAAVAGAGAPRP